MYISVTFNHFRAVQQWAVAHGAQAQLDMATFQLELKCRGRYHTFHPLFPAEIHGRFVHTTTLTPEVIGFGGWLPYRTYTTPLATDKLLFKQAATRAGMSVPRTWHAGETPAAPYLVKRSRGSFGYDLHGPFAAGSGDDVQASTGDAPPAFAEEFIEGRILKVWYWGSRAFFAHVQDYPVITGDGQATAGELVERQAAGTTSIASAQASANCLRYQGLDLDTVLPAGRTAWFDYRYGRVFGTRKSSSTSDNQLEALLKASGDQVGHAGRSVAAALAETIPVPVMVTVDGILDRQGRIWWLEMNSNSLLPPEGYQVILSDLFAIPPAHDGLVRGNIPAGSTSTPTNAGF